MRSPIALSSTLIKIGLAPGNTIHSEEAMLKTLTLDVVKSSEIEGEILNPEQVRSSIARRLGMNIAGLVPADRRVDGVVRMALEATQDYAQSLTAERLFGWHKAPFPSETKPFSI